jgi:transcriptional regulator with XRE-family HTH domain
VDLAELGLFLASRRGRITPEAARIPAGPRRRVPGLRRDEVAALAGASTDYYIELERGRGAQPSAQMLTALARALQLDGDERHHLFTLAGRQAPAPDDTPVREAMSALLDRLTDPARIMTDLHETLVQNAAMTALLGPPDREHLHHWFTEPAVRHRYPVEDHAHHSRVLTADLRAAVARRGGGGRAADLVTRLRRDSPEFATLWATGDVAVRRGDRKRIVHEDLGVVDVVCHNLFSEDGLQRLQFFTGPALDRQR